MYALPQQGRAVVRQRHAVLRVLFFPRDFNTIQTVITREKKKEKAPTGEGILSQERALPPHSAV